MSKNTVIALLLIALGLSIIYNIRLNKITTTLQNKVTNLQNKVETMQILEAIQLPD